MKTQPVLVLLNLFLIGSICEAAVPVAPVKNSEGVSRFHKAIPVILPYPNGLECDACQFLAQGLNRTLFHNEHLIDIVQGEMDRICDILPASVHDICLQAVNNTVPDVVGKIGDYVATEGCTELGICKDKLS